MPSKTLQPTINFNSFLVRWLLPVTLWSSAATSRAYVEYTTYCRSQPSVCSCCCCCCCARRLRYRPSSSDTNKLSPNASNRLCSCSSRPGPAAREPNNEMLPTSLPHQLAACGRAAAAAQSPADAAAATSRAGRHGLCDVPVSAAAPAEGKAGAGAGGSGVLPLLDPGPAYTCMHRTTAPPSNLAASCCTTKTSMLICLPTRLKQYCRRCRLWRMRVYSE